MRAGVSALGSYGSSVWVGYDDGRVAVFGMEDEASQRSFKPHSGRITSIVGFAEQVRVSYCHGLSTLPNCGCLA